jgi:FlaA1/EpsC-like NDP-sugar epimerase
MESRRQFLQTSAGAMVASNTVLGANERIQLGVIGTGTRGTSVASKFVMNEDCAVVAACDVARSKLDSAAAKIAGQVATYGDYRRLLDRKNIDAVLIATPDHWHSQVTVDVCAAGKGIYVEKPASNTIPAAQRMLAAAQKYRRVVQVGLQQRSWASSQQLANNLITMPSLLSYVRAPALSDTDLSGAASTRLRPAPRLARPLRNRAPREGCTGAGE